ncbi:MAG: transcription antitermination factor NusB [Gemmatimonadota bacterium]|jgi:N utilization substance protein B|nr:transcription antitermination factor NusB [Gemmatimonadota bacterium]MDP6802756.1 transcription antitermination factor NusB [Gemmatimonadota bacterium]MDP7031723.1 transcription antitermination factor NusB [Gemmatimonadota bacterium]
MGRRRLARETAFRQLFRVDLTGKDLTDALVEIGDLRREASRGTVTREADPEDAETFRFSQELLESVGAHRVELMEALASAADRFEIGRMAAVDRSLLLLGAAEILYWPTIPDEVTIDEYVALAGKYSAEGSVGFVNAVLDRLARENAAGGARP